ncbi:MAG: ABC transporter permease [Acidobacteria bacterium]|nr:ABC transporter permease [Acidobacteriota bacterium]
MTLWRDLGFAARMLWKNPGFTAVAVLAVALGVGANTTIFSVVNALLLRPFAYETTQRVVMVWERGVDQTNNRNSVAPANYMDWRDQTRVFEELAAYGQQHFSINEGEQPERVPGAVVTPSLFRVLAARAERGRTFSEEEGKAGADPVVLIKHSLWLERFGADPDIVGRTVRIDNKPRTVVGVMPEEFDFPLNACQVWAPLAFDADDAKDRDNHYLQVVGLMRPGVSVAQADAEVRAVADRARTLYPDTNGGRTAFAESLTDSFTRGPKPYIIVLLGAVGFVLLIACANVANLLLVRASSRQRELAVRTALGASRWRLIRQLLTESLLLALIGGAAGLLFSVWGVDFISKGMPPTFTKYIPGWKHMRIDSTVLLFTLGASVLTGIVFGIVPALQATRTNLNEALKEGGQRGSTGGRNLMRSVLVVAEVALSLVLLAGAGLMVRSFYEMMRADLGLRPDGVLVAQMSLPKAAYPEKAQSVDFYERLVARMRALPGVASAAAINFVPMSRDGNSSSQFYVEGRPAPPPDRRPYANYNVVTPGYFETAGTRVLRGRGFQESDDERAPLVCVVNETLARHMFPGEDPVGHRLVVSEKEAPWEIVGVSADVKNEDLAQEAEWEFYRPHRQEPWYTMALVVRAGEGQTATGLAPLVRGEVKALDAGLPVYNVRTMQDVVDEAVSPKRLTMFLLAFFAAGALLLAAVGLYAVMSYAVAQRRHEIGIRLALGAQGRDILTLVLSQGLLLTLVGLGLGLAGALGVTRVMASILYGVSATDPLVFGGVALVLAAAALLACYVPARRATKVDPMIALRYE